MKRIVECVINVSEGRKKATLERLVAAIRAVRGAMFLDLHCDPDHHRSVLTFAGEPDSVAEAAFQVIAKATEFIDLDRHRGGHPRIGAADVVPFVPIRAVTMDDCIQLARRLGEQVGRELSIPVFLYEQAASRKARQALERIRRGGLTGLAARMATDPDWRPDFGPVALHPTAGACVIGARPPLIAYNINLLTESLDIARHVARCVRTSSGGLPSVKAIGVPLRSRGLVQVSMNLTNFEETSLATVFEAVAQEARVHGVEIAGSELVGLVPQEAMLQALAHTLRFEHLESSQVLETRMIDAISIRKEPSIKQRV